MVELGVMRMFVEHHIFKAIPDQGISISDLVANTHVDYNLLERFPNFLIATRVLSSPAPGQVTHTTISNMFQEPKATLFYPHIFDSFMATAVKWPEYFSLNGLTEPQKSNRAPFGFATGHPNKSFYEVLETMPERAKSFNSTMALALGDMPITGMYDFSWVAERANQSKELDRALIVDVGSGKGQALKAILDENPKIPAGSCVLQDQANVIQQASEETGVIGSVKKIGSSFFDEQQVEGALIYYIRRVLNDWSDDECVQILSQIRAACAMDSRVLISENLLPDEPSVSLAAADLWMMNFAGKRRNERKFNDIASRAGFKISSISKDKATNSAVLELVPV